MQKPDPPIDVSDDEDAPSFVEAHWICTGKRYPVQDTPGYILRARDAQLAIPEASRAHLLPSISLPVEQFLSFKFPAQSAAISESFSNISKWFSNQPANSDLAAFFNHPIPSKSVLRRLKEAFGQAWFDGCRSIVDHRVQDGKRYPVWGISLWLAMAEIGEYHKLWKQGVAWCKSEIEVRQKKGDHATVKLLEEAQEKFQNLPWNSQMDFERGNTTTRDLVLFLGTKWLNDTHINMMVQTFAEKLAEKGDSTILVAPLTFSYDIKDVDRKLKQPERRFNRTLLKAYERRITEDGIKKLFFPLHVNENHWIAGMIDFENSTISYGVWSKISPG
jgi:Ulp1 protease family, C-terminal catalytic domain